MGCEVPRDLGDEVSVQGVAGEIAEQARDLLRKICQVRDVVIVQRAVSPDHAHMLMSVSPQLAPAKLVHYIKGRSSRMVQEEFPQLKKRYWGSICGRGDISARAWARWTRKRFGDIYRSQKWEEPGENFKITAPSEP
jgi:putative transposase